MLGERFGRLVILELLSAYKLRVRCDCGNEKVVTKYNVKKGMTTSCGCRRREVTIARSTKHGNAQRGKHSGAYNSWTAMLSRVDFPEKWKAKHYRERGITICDRWRTFADFLADMGDRPAGTSLDRIDNDRGYEPGNCRWATKAQQARNTRRNVFVTYKGSRVCITDAARLSGISVDILQKRIERNCAADALFAR